MNESWPTPQHQLDDQERDWIVWRSSGGYKCACRRSHPPKLLVERLGPKQWKWHIQSEAFDSEVTMEEWRRVAKEMDETISSKP